MVMRWNLCCENPKPGFANFETTYRKYQDDSGELMVKIRIGEEQEEIKLDPSIMRTKSTFFAAFSVPPMSYMSQVPIVVDRLVHLDQEEVIAFGYIVTWCEVEGIPITDYIDTLTIDEWCRAWSLTITLGMPSFQKEIAKVRHQWFNSGDTVRSTAAVQYLYNHGHHQEDDDGKLWREFALQFAADTECEDGSLVDRRPDLFPDAFVGAYFQSHFAVVPAQYPDLVLKVLFHSQIWRDGRF